MTRKLIIEADGGSRGNPGPAGFGAVVRDQATGELLREICDSIGTATNNVAEYSGLIAGLRAAAEISPGADVEARMDSRLVVEQMSGRWQIKHENLRSLARTARDAAAGLGRVRYTWVPRARNAHADRLANQAMDSAMGEQPAGGGRHGKPRNAKVLSEPDATEPDPAAASPRGWARADGQPTTTLLLRHGQTEFSAERRFAGRGDIALTDTGRRQAVAAADQLAARGIDAIVTSPLQRARKTAEAVAAATGAPLAVDDGLVEADFGKWEGLTFGEAAQRWPEEMSAWLASADVAPPGGESLADAARRVLGTLDRLLAARPRETLLLVSHVTPIKTLACRALLAPPAAMFRIHLDVASLTEIDWFADGPALVRSLNDTAHLRQPAR
ncbi:MAG TPA: bifunctional RNase H/acid phosphatase [Streptosporangiaceae bacterium]|nr:bifunctional RNase H/acid phosphatase [Streptosporangiaceae bacterium]